MRAVFWLVLSVLLAMPVGAQAVTINTAGTTIIDDATYASERVTVSGFQTVAQFDPGAVVGFETSSFDFDGVGFEGDADISVFATNGGFADIRGGDFAGGYIATFNGFGLITGGSFAGPIFVEALGGTQVSELQIDGGQFADPVYASALGGSSRADLLIRGGDFDGPISIGRLGGTSEVNLEIVGTQFEIDGSPATFGLQSFSGTRRLTGTLANGDSIDVLLNLNSSGSRTSFTLTQGSIQVATPGLLGLFGLGLVAAAAGGANRQVRR